MTHPSEQTFEDVPLNLIDPPSTILRESIDPEALGQLADSIAAEGLHQPIGLINDPGTERYRIVWGHRRYMAHQLLRKSTIAARILQQGTDTLLAAITENLQRADLTPIEEAHAIQRLLETGEPMAAIARLMRRSHTWITSRLHLLDLPTDLQDAIRETRLTMSVAAALAPVDNETYRRSLIEEATRSGASAATAGLWAQHYEADKGRILSNAYTVEEITRNREAWRYVVECDVCKAPTPFEDTRTIRLCITCHSAAEDALDQEQPGTEGPPETALVATNDQPPTPT